MGTGEIRDFRKPNPLPTPTRDPDRYSAITGVEVRVHEEIVTEDDKLRGRKREPGEPEIRIRVGDGTEWERVKRGDED